jgi:hypothetical protein
VVLGIGLRPQLLGDIDKKPQDSVRIKEIHDTAKQQGRLSDKQYYEYQTHTSFGHDIIKQNENIDSSISTPKKQLRLFRQSHPVNRRQHFYLQRTLYLFWPV